jgi:hypothetical protein
MYTHMYDHDDAYFNARDCRDSQINSGVISRVEHVHKEYKRDIDALQETIRKLEDENKHLKEELDGCSSKQAHTHEPLPYPERPQGNSYASAIAWPVPVPAPCPIVPNEDITMNEVYTPLPNLPPLMYNTSVPDYPRAANW